MNAYDDHAESLKQIQDELGGACPTFHWNNDDWKILPGTANCLSNLDVGGFKLASTLKFVTLADQFEQPAETTKNQMLNTNMDYKGDQWIIKVISIPGTGKQLHIEAHQVTP